MNRIEFMTELAALLQDVPEEERRDAMKFYNDYFDDAGEENEQQVIAELENPAKVAATIKEDLGSASREQGEYTEKGFRDSRFENKEMPAGRDYQGRDYQGTGYESYGEQTPPKTNNALKIFGAPVIIPLAVAVIAVLAACGIALLALFLSLIVASAAVVFAGVCVFIAGVLSLIPEIAVGLALIGTGLILTAIGVVATVASTRLCLIVLPGICRGFIWILRWPFQRRVVA